MNNWRFKGTNIGYLPESDKITANGRPHTTQKGYLISIHGDDLTCQDVKDDFFKENPQDEIAEVETMMTSTQPKGNDKLLEALGLNTKIKHEPHQTKHEVDEVKHENNDIKHETKHSGLKNSKYIGTYFHFSKPFHSSRELAKYLEISNATAINWAKNNKNNCSLKKAYRIDNQP